MTDRDQVSRWLDAYVAAWRTYDREAIGELFSDDVECRYHPYDPPIRGRAAVVESWLGEGDHEGAPEPDEPGTYDAEYRPVAIDGDLAVVTGRSTYYDRPGGRVTEVFFNCFLLRFDDEGRCRELTEYYVQRPEGADA